MKNNRVKLTERRKKVIYRLEEQLKSGTKPERGVPNLTRYTTGGEQLAFSDNDKKRIHKELEILKSRV